MIKNIKLRFVTTFIGLPILGLMVWLGGYFFSVTIAIISVWGTIEICLLCSKKGFDKSSGVNFDSNFLDSGPLLYVWQSV